jgi:hypothetical protein
MAPNKKRAVVYNRNPVATKKSTAARARTSVVAKSSSKAEPKKATRRRVLFEDRIFAGVHHKSGRLATIRNVIASDIPTRTGVELSLDERVRLAMRRIEENNYFVSMRMLGVSGVIDKKRTLEEIKKLSPLGLHLLDIDMRHARLQIEQSLAVRAKRRKKNGTGNDGHN